MTMLWSIGAVVGLRMLVYTRSIVEDSWRDPREKKNVGEIPRKKVLGKLCSDWGGRRETQAICEDTQVLSRLNRLSSTEFP